MSVQQQDRQALVMKQCLHFKHMNLSKHFTMKVGNAFKTNNLESPKYHIMTEISQIHLIYLLKAFIA